MFNKKNILLVALLALLTVTSSTLSSANPPEYDNVTLTISKGAQVAAFMSKMDVNRCDDFYSWACDGWSRHHPATESTPKNSYLTLLNDAYVRKSVIVLQEPQTTEDDEIVKSLKDFYASCRSDLDIRRIGLEPLYDYMNFDGGWPIISNATWYENDYDWLTLVAFSKRQFNADAFIGFDVVNDVAYADTYRIQLGAPKLPLGSRSAYLDARFEEKRKAYGKHILAKLAAFFPTMPLNWPREVAAQVLEVEQRLAKAVPESAPLKERYVAELKTSYGSYVDLSRYLSHIFNKTINEKVYETQKGYFANLVEIIKITPKLILANYTYWKIVDQFDLGGDAKHCAAKTMSYFPFQLEHAMKRAFTYDREFSVLEGLFRDIINELQNVLQNSAQFATLTSQTKAALKQRLTAMKLSIGADHLPQLNTNSVRVGHYIPNTIRILQWQATQIVAKYLGNATEDPISANMPANYATLVLPVYNAKTNSVLVPTQFLQPHVFWDPVYPEAFKHGTFTYLLAQQIVYGLHNPPMDSDFQALLRKHGKCLESQHCYAANHFQGKNMRDPQLLQRVMADNAALRISHHLYDEWLRAGGTVQHRDRALPMVHYTSMEQFFIAYAQIYCASYHDSVESFSELAEALRVNGALTNLDAFAKAYQCNSHSALARGPKCVLY